MKRINSFGVVILLLAVFSVCLSLVTSRNRVYAAANDIIISEIMYNPSSGLDGDEYLEIYNTTGSTIDLSGWCFTSGINLCFSSGTSLSAHSYGLVSSNSAQTLGTYGKTTIGTYTGALSNGGETLSLSDSSNNIVNSVTYDDNSPWPTSPDGNGPSLELKDVSSDNSQPASWGASITPTPGEENSLANITPPTIHNLTQPASIQTASNVKIVASVDGATTVNLVYKVMFNPDQTISMIDDGTGADDTAGDNLYTAQIPSQAAGSLVRFKVEATNSDGTTSSPSNSDSINYKSYIVDDGQSSTLPIIRWYIDPNVYDDLVTNHASDDFYVPTIVAVGDQIFDGAKVKVKGQSSTNYPKKKFTFDLPSGHSLGPPYFEHPVDKFSINAYFLNMTDLQERLAWLAFSHYGFDDLQAQYVRVQKNNNTDTSSFFGHYLMIEGYDSEWRERTNHQQGALYKQFSDKKTRQSEDDSDIISLRSNLQNLTGTDLKNYILDNLDVPELINYDALSTILASQDWEFYKNLYQYRDTEGTGRWSLLPWDLDNALAMPIFKPESSPIYFNLDPLHSNNDPTYNSDRLTQNAMYQFPEFRDMYYRRVATLYDQIYQSGQLLNWYTDLYNKSKTTIDEDLVEWKDEKSALLNLAFPSGLPWEFRDDFPFSITPEEAMSGQSTAAVQDAVFRYGYGKFIQQVEAQRSSGNLPSSQANNPEVIISELNYNPATNQDDQYIELYNPNDIAVDISGWQLSGDVSLTLPQGSVLPAKGYGVLVKNDTQFRQSYSGSQIVLAQYQGSLSQQPAHSLTLSHANQVSSSLKYGTNNPWPSSPNTNGFSLALAKLNGDYTNPYCWAPSSSPGGTPGSANTTNQDWVNQNIAKCSVRSNLASTGQSQTYLLALSLIFITTPLYQLIHLKSKLKSLMISIE